MHEMETVASDITTREISVGRCTRCGREWDSNMPPIVAFSEGNSMCRNRTKFDCCYGYFVRRICDYDCSERVTRADMWGLPRLSAEARRFMSARAVPTTDRKRDDRLEFGGSSRNV